MEAFIIHSRLFIYFSALKATSPRCIASLAVAIAKGEVA